MILILGTNSIVLTYGGNCCSGHRREAASHLHCICAELSVKALKNMTLYVDILPHYNII